MLLTKKLVISELEKFFPEIKFNQKYAEDYIKTIKYCLLNNLKEKIKEKEIEEVISIMEEFTFKVERENQNLDSIKKIENSLIEEIKDILINSFNPNYINLKKGKKLSIEKQCLLLKLLIFQENEKEISLFTGNQIEKYIFLYNSNRTIKNIKEIRELIRNKEQITETRENLFNFAEKQAVIYNLENINESKLVKLTNFLFGYPSGFNEVYINLDYEIKITNTHTEFLTKEFTKGYIPNERIHNRELLRQQKLYKERKEMNEKYKNLFLTFKITK